MKKSLLYLYRATFWAMLLAMAWQTGMHLWMYYQGAYGYDYGCINEMLINYEGGFVRRGLFGEILWGMRSVFSFSVTHVIVIIYYTGFLSLAVLLVRLFKRNGWSLFILPFPVCMYVYLCDPYFLVGRRDCWLLLLAFLCFNLYHRYIKNGETTLYLVLCNVCLFFCVLFHEAALFFILPFIVIHDFNKVYKQKGLIMSIKKAILHWGSVFIIVAFVIFYHGDGDVVTNIWYSWAPYLECPVDESLVNESYMSRTLGGMSLLMNIKVAWETSWFPNIIGRIPVAPFNLYVLGCIYYLVTHINLVDLKIYKLKLINRIALSNSILIGFLFLVVYIMITCDWGRDIPYWVICSLMFFHYFQEKDDYPLFVTRMSIYLKNHIDHIAILNKDWFYYILIMTLPLGFVGASISSMFPCLPLQLKHLLIDDSFIVVT